MDVIKRISIERSQGSVLCTRRRLTLEDNGLATLEIEGCRDPQEDRRRYCERRYGYISEADFADVAALSEGKDFFSLDSSYYVNATHQEFVLVSEAKGGIKKTVEDYGHAGPARLEELELVISGAETRVGEWGIPQWEVVETGPCDWSVESPSPAWYSPNHQEMTPKGGYSNPSFGFRTAVTSVLAWGAFDAFPLVNHGAVLPIATVESPVWADRNLIVWAEFASLQSTPERCMGPYFERFVDPDDKSNEIRRTTVVKKIHVAGLHADLCHTVFESKPWSDAIVKDEVVLTRSDERVRDPAERSISAIQYRFVLNTLKSSYPADRRIFDAVLRNVEFSRPELWNSQ
ncbi:MAG: hypothetical protein ACHQ50_15890 [Fimbriimonadales bacterium]